MNSLYLIKIIIKTVKQKLELTNQGYKNIITIYSVKLIFNKFLSRYINNVYIKYNHIELKYIITKCY